MPHSKSPPPDDDNLTTQDVATRLGLAVRSVQLMVDRGELQAWRTPGGHRRIQGESVEAWLRSRQRGGPAPIPAAVPDRPRVLLIEDSVHYQTLVRLLLEQQLPEVELAVASDAVAGMVQFGQRRPQVLVVDILLPNLDGASLIASTRSHAMFQDCKLLVITSMDEEQLAPYAFALQGVPVVHKSRLVTELPARLRELLATGGEAR